MADNTGTYINTAQLIPQIANSGQGEAYFITLSAKALIAGTVYEYVYSSTENPAVGDWLVQGSVCSAVISVDTSTSKLQLEVGTEITNASAKFYNFESIYTQSDFDTLIAESMNFIDRTTRQWFNSRDKVLPIDGSNCETLFLPVPILSISEIKLNDRDNDAEVFDTNISEYFWVYSNRGVPDDRKNPRIAFKKEVGLNVFCGVIGGRSWLSGRTSYITGKFGFLEEDGTTPLLIQRATLKYAVILSKRSVGELASDAVALKGKGPVRREKTDFHEIEYYNSGNLDGKTAAINAGTGLSGDDEIDDIIAMYRAPIFLGASSDDYGAESPVFRSGF